MEKSIVPPKFVDVKMFDDLLRKQDDELLLKMTVKYTIL